MLFFRHLDIISKNLSFNCIVKRYTGVKGIEPLYDGFKVHCLTTWRYSKKKSIEISKLPTVLRNPWNKSLMP